MFSVNSATAQTKAKSKAKQRSFYEGAGYSLYAVPPVVSCSLKHTLGSLSNDSTALLYFCFEKAYDIA